MRKAFLSALFSLLLVLPAPAASLKDYIQSVAFLQTDKGHCTAWSVRLGQWLSEGHCVAEAEVIVINDQEANIIKYSDEDAEDLVLLSGPQVSPLELATEEAVYDDDGKFPTVAFGWPADFAEKRPLVFTGALAATDVKDVANFGKHPVNLFNLGGGGGMSGAPIMQAGKVVGMVEAIRLFPGQVTAGQTVKRIRKFIK